jgi:hypothetical protein
LICKERIETPLLKVGLALALCRDPAAARALRLGPAVPELLRIRPCETVPLPVPPLPVLIPQKKILGLGLIKPVSTFALNFNGNQKNKINKTEPLLAAGSAHTVHLYPNPTASVKPLHPKSLVSGNTGMGQNLSSLLAPPTQRTGCPRSLAPRCRSCR